MNGFQVAVCLNLSDLISFHFTHVSVLQLLGSQSLVWNGLPRPQFMVSHELHLLSLQLPEAVQGPSAVQACPLDWPAAAAAKSLQSCPTLCDPIDGSPLGSSVPGILQARTLEWVAISFSSAWKWKVKVKSLTRAWLLATPWTAAHQAPPPMGFARQEYWSGMPSPFLHTYICIYKFTDNKISSLEFTVVPIFGKYIQCHNQNAEQLPPPPNSHTLTLYGLSFPSFKHQ